MLKHGLISNVEHWAELLSFDTINIDYAALKRLVGKSVQVKEEIVEQDPFERNIRKALNLGHTVGHAFESMALAETVRYCMVMQSPGELYVNCTCPILKSVFRKRK